MIEHSETRYARSGDLHIAYRVAGDGPLDLLFIPGFMSNADLMSEIPWMRHNLDRLAALGRVVYFDKRGVGVSDRSLGTGTAEDRMDDLRAVLDAAGVEQAVVIGLSEGGPLALLFAAAHPGRVRSLVCWGAAARILRDADYPDGVDPGVADGLVSRVEEWWGTGRAVRAFVDAPRDDASDRAMARFERQSASPRGAAEVLRRNIDLDARAALGAIHVPTLVVHRRGDPLVPAAVARYMAEHIDGAQYVELPGSWHVSGYVARDDDVFDVIAEFVAGAPVDHGGEVERVLATVLFTDIVDSTAHASTMGDRQWRAVLEQHDVITRREVQAHRGEVVKQTGDGLLATFDGPGRAVRAAGAIRDAVALLGLEVRAGVHTGEIERREDDVAGIAVHIGARLAAAAGPGEVLVSGTVKDLVVGSGLDFADRGSVELKGVAGEWRVFAAVG